MRKRKEKKEKKPRTKRSWHLFSSNTDFWILFSALILALFGTLMIVSVEQGQSIGEPLQLLVNVAKQMAFLLASIFLFLVMGKYYRFNKRESSLLMCGYILFGGLMILTFFMGTEIYGSKAWLRLGPVSLQPSEFAKPLVIASFANASYQASVHPQREKHFWSLYREPFLFTALACITIIMAQKDFGTAIIVASIALVCFLIPNYKAAVKFRRFVLGTLAAGIVVVGITVSSDTAVNLLNSNSLTAHIATRIENMKNPYTDVYGEGFQPANSLYGIADAGIFGKGIGNSNRKYGYLTQAESDYILAVVIEETGIAGLTLIVALYGIIVYRLFGHALKAKRMAYKIVLMGTASYLLLHFIINVGGVGALIPMTGVPLLFISAGGSSLMAVSIAVGMSLGCIEAMQEKPARRRRMFHPRKRSLKEGA